MVDSLSSGGEGQPKVADKDADNQNETAAAAHVWGRDGEGPHSIVVPEAGAANDSPAQKSTSSVSDSTLFSNAAPSTSTSPSTSSILPAGANAGEVSDPSSDEACSVIIDVGESDVDETGANDAGEEDGDEDETGEEDIDEDKTDQKSRPSGFPTQDDYVIGNTFPLCLYFIVYSVNALAGGYCLTSARVDALAEIFFFWTPALVAGCLLLGSRWLKLAGAILILPLAGGAIFAGQYFHLFERFQGEISPYGPLANVYDANGWHICRYESAWTGKGSAAVTYTREKDVGPYLKYVKKMHLGEPP